MRERGSDCQAWKVFVFWAVNEGQRSPCFGISGVESEDRPVAKF